MINGLRTLSGHACSCLIGNGSRATAPDRRDRVRGFLAGAALALLTACGGGGGGSGGGFIPEEPGSDLTSYRLEVQVVDATGAPTSQVSETFPARLLVRVTEDNRDAAPVSGVVVSAAAEFARISPENGQGLSNGEGIAELQIRAGTALGADTITITVSSPAGDVSATVAVEVVAAGITLGSFDGTAFVPGRIGLSSDSIAYRGSAVLRFAVVDENGAPVDAVQRIRLSSACSVSGRATFRPVDDAGDGTTTLTVETSDALATAVYLAGSCEGSDQLTASLLDANSIATATISIAPRDSDYIGFLTSDPSEGEEGAGRTILAIRDTGSESRTELGRITFEVLESAVDLEPGDPAPGEAAYLDLPGRRPLAGVPVEFALTNAVGGITLLSNSAVSDGRGLVVAEVRSGIVPASTRVTATLLQGDAGQRPQTATSNEIVIGTGVADQNSISLTAERLYVPLAAELDGVSVAVTVRIADKFNNPVPDGTSAVFTTEYGAIDASCLTGTANGARFQAERGTDAPLRGTCSVLWISQAPRFPTFRPDLVRRTDDRAGYDCLAHSGREGPCPVDLGAIRGLRSTILVTTPGDEFFVDSNGNAIYDEGEPFENLPEAFVDNNEDGVYTPIAGPQCPPPSTEETCSEAGFEEVFIDYNGDGQYSDNLDPNTGEGVYNGSLCPPEGDGIFCSREPVSVRDSLVLTLSSGASSQNALLASVNSVPARITSVAREFTDYEIYIADIFNNSPGVGSTITLEADGDCRFRGPDQDTITRTVRDRAGAPGAFSIGFQIEDRERTTDPDQPNPEDTGEGSIFVSVADPEDPNDVLVATFQCQTLGCVDGSGSLLSPPPFGCPVP